MILNMLMPATAESPGSERTPEKQYPASWLEARDAGH